MGDWGAGRGRDDELEGGNPGGLGRYVTDGTGEPQAVVSPLAIGISKKEKDEIPLLTVAIRCKPRYT